MEVPADHRRVAVYAGDTERAPMMCPEARLEEEADLQCPEAEELAVELVAAHKLAEMHAADRAPRGHAVADSRTAGVEALEGRAVAVMCGLVEAVEALVVGASPLRQA